jgi:glycine hydroxymethyltransferase
MGIIVDLIDRILQDVDNESVITDVRKTVNQMMNAFPMFAW